MTGYKLTPEQAESLKNQQFADSQFFYPVMDINNDYFISEQEVNNCDNANFIWVKDLTPSEYIPPTGNF